MIAVWATQVNGRDAMIQDDDGQKDRQREHDQRELTEIDLALVVGGVQKVREAIAD